MAFRETDRAKAARIRRTYACDVCAHEWRVEHIDADEPIPDCPQCEHTASQVRTPVGVLTTKTQAVNFTQKMMEEQGYTNFKDNQRPGDTAVMAPPPMQTAERDQIGQELAQAGLSPALTPDQAKMTENFWANSAGQQSTRGDPAVDRAIQMAVASAPAAAAAARAEGVDPIAALNKHGRPGLKLDVVSSVKG